MLRLELAEETAVGHSPRDRGRSLHGFTPTSGESGSHESRGHWHLPLRETADAIEPGAPVELFDLQFRVVGFTRGIHSRSDYAVTADGQRFLAVTPVRSTASTADVQVVFNWTASLKK